MNSTLDPMPTYSSLSTVDALSRLAEWRDPVAWAAILEQHGAGILRVAQRASGDAAMCDDVCQETLLQIRAHAGSFCPPAPPHDAEAAARGWIMRIACRTAFKMVRTRQRLSLRDARAVHVSNVPLSAADSAQMREESEKVRRETMELPEAVREPICLRFFGEMTYPELGAALGCSEEAAKKRVQRGLDVLRSRLVAHGIVLSVAALSGVLSQGSAHAAELAAATAVTTSSATSGASAASAINPQQFAAWQALLQSGGAPALSGIVTIGGMTVMAKTVFSAAIVVLFLISGAQALSIHSLQSETAQARAAVDQAAKNASALERKLDEGRNEIADLKAQLSSQQKEAFALGNQVAELKKSGATQAQWPGVTVAGVPANGQKRVFIGGRNANGATGADANVQEFNIAIPPDAVQFAVPEIQTIALPEATKKALKDAGVNVDDVLKNVNFENTFQFNKDVDVPGGKMSVRVMKNGGVVTATTQTNTQNPAPLPKQPGQKPPAPPEETKTPADPNGNF